MDRESHEKVVERLQAPSVNPFCTKTPRFSLYERIKFYIGLLTLVPIRLILIVLILFIFVIVSKIALIGVTDEDLKKPPTAGRKKLLVVYQ